MRALAGAFRRVGVIERRLHVGVCPQKHESVRHFFVWNDDPVPQWPEENTRQVYDCGRELVHRRKVVHYRWLSADAW